MSDTSGKSTFVTGKNLGQSKFSLPWLLILKGAACGLLVVGVLALGAFIPDLQQTSLLAGIGTNDFQSEFWTLLGITLVILGGGFFGIGLPALLLRGSRTAKYIIFFLTELTIIAIALIITTNYTPVSSSNNMYPCNNFSGVCSNVNTGI